MLREEERASAVRAVGNEAVVAWRATAAIAREGRTGETLRRAPEQRNNVTTVSKMSTGHSMWRRGNGGEWRYRWRTTTPTQCVASARYPACCEP